MRNRVKKARFYRGLPQVALARKCRIDTATLSRVEAGYVDLPPEKRERLARVLGCPAEWLFPPEDSGAQDDLPPWEEGGTRLSPEQGEADK